MRVDSRNVREMPPNSDVGVDVVTPHKVEECCGTKYGDDSCGCCRCIVVLLCDDTFLRFMWV